MFSKMLFQGIFSQVEFVYVALKDNAFPFEIKGKNFQVDGKKKARFSYFKVIFLEKKHFIGQCMSKPDCIGCAVWSWSTLSAEGPGVVRGTLGLKTWSV